MSYEEIGLLCSRSWSQQNFKMSVNVCPDDIFRITEPFTTKLGMVMHHQEPHCLNKLKIGLLSSRSRSQLRINKFKICLFNIFSELMIILQLNLV